MPRHKVPVMVMSKHLEQQRSFSGLKRQDDKQGAAVGAPDVNRSAPFQCHILRVQTACVLQNVPNQMSDGLTTAICKTRSSYMCQNREAAEETPPVFPPRDSFVPFTYLRDCKATGGAFRNQRSSTECSGWSIRGDRRLTEPPHS